MANIKRAQQLEASDENRMRQKNKTEGAPGPLKAGVFWGDSKCFVIQGGDSRDGASGVDPNSRLELDAHSFPACAFDLDPSIVSPRFDQVCAIDYNHERFWRRQVCICSLVSPLSRSRPPLILRVCCRWRGGPSRQSSQRHSGNGNRGGGQGGARGGGISSPGASSPAQEQHVPVRGFNATEAKNILKRGRTARV